MSRQIHVACLKCICSLVLLLVFTMPALGQSSSTASVTGIVQDTSDARIANASIKLINTQTGTESSSKTNNEGGFALPSVMPGSYSLQIERDGFETTRLTGIVLNVGDNKALIIRMKVGSSEQTVMVDGSGLTINTIDASVSTVVDRTFAENLPLNGRSFQSLMELTPGVVPTASTSYDSGQFSVNGQRADSNYWTVDGVSANIGMGSTNYQAGNSLSGGLPSFSVTGGTNSLVSVDALQEFRIQTSTYAPEFGRTPGGQIQIVTRSGENVIHGTVFDYFRNDALDANTWFANNESLPKAEERQNDFGGIFEGPLRRNSLFYFFSYEGLRLRLPETTLTTVPDMSARAAASSYLAPYFDAYPLPSATGVDDLKTGTADADYSYSNKSSLDAYSLRLDEKLSEKLNLFARYNYSPSSLLLRGTGNALSNVSPSSVRTQTLTVGATLTIQPSIVNDLRFNYSRVNTATSSYLDNFGGAIPLPSIPFPSPFTGNTAAFVFGAYDLTDGFLSSGLSQNDIQRQFNVVDSLSIQHERHTIKLGVDFRRLTPTFGPPEYTQGAYFSDVLSMESGSLLYSNLVTTKDATFLFRNLGVFAQDTWRASDRATITYGARWDVDYAPQSLRGPAFSAVTGFHLSDLSNLALAPAGTPVYYTPYLNIAPRFGLAYQAHSTPGQETVLRVGFGTFYDMATQEFGNGVYADEYPFGISILNFGGSFPLSSATAAPPVIVAPAAGVPEQLTAFDPHLALPYVLQWSTALEQALGRDQSVSLTYVGSSGRSLIQSALVVQPNANIALAQLVENAGHASYNSLQVQFQRRLQRGLQITASYSWAHSIDTGSAGSLSTPLSPTLGANADRGPSDFDVRNAFTSSLTYDLPSTSINHLEAALSRGWSVASTIQARSAAPVNVYEGSFSTLFNGLATVRPDVVEGQPLYLYGSQYPGGKEFNPSAFVSPPVDANGSPLRQGDLARNALRAFSAAEWDFALHRNFHVRDKVNLEFRSEMFNILNHPNFGPPDGDLADSTFGQSTSTLGQYLGGNIGGGGFSSLYQIGGPRSIQLALKLRF